MHHRRSFHGGAKYTLKIIFEVEGETGFRMREHKVLNEAIRKTNVVIATGGGAPIEKNNRELLREGIVFYLFSKPSSIWKRLAHDDSRPILQNSNNIKDTIFDLFSRRDPVYRDLAHHLSHDDYKQSRQLYLLTVPRELENLL